MALETGPIKGRDVALYVQKTVAGALKYVRVGCVGDLSLDLDTEVDEATCSDSGLWKEFVTGQNSWGASSNLTARSIAEADVDTNISVAELTALQIAQTPILIRFTLDDDNRYGGKAIITKNSFKGQLKGAATGAISLQGTGPLAVVEG
ncbi:MAG: phage tail tube protein [Janthinobacterium lividum]